jgi:hypothetical protein
MPFDKPIKASPNLYTYIFFSLKEIALEYGYNLVIHGSMNRDLDLIAVPWEENVKDIDEMVDAFVEYLKGNLYMRDGERFIYKKYNRRVYLIGMCRSLMIKNEYVMCDYYVDLSVYER